MYNSSLFRDSAVHRDRLRRPISHSTVCAASVYKSPILSPSSSATARSDKRNVSELVERDKGLCSDGLSLRLLDWRDLAGEHGCRQPLSFLRLLSVARAISSWKNKSVMWVCIACCRDSWFVAKYLNTLKHYFQFNSHIIINSLFIKKPRTIR